MFSNKKKLVAIAATSGLLLAGLVGVSPAQATEPTLVVWADERRGPNLKTLFGSLESQTVGKYVSGYKIDVVAYSNFDALKAAVDEATPENGPDVILGPNDWVSTGVQNGKLASITLSNAVKSQFAKSAINDLTYQGKLYGVPLDYNNVAMIRNKKLAPMAPKTFGDMVDVYLAKKSSKKLTAGLCIAGGGISFGGYSVLSALGGGAYQMKSDNVKVDTRKSPTDVAAFTANVKKYLLKANGKTNGFFTTGDCKQSFLDGKVPYAVIGNWEWSDYEDAGFSMNTAQPVPGVKAGTYGSAFGSVSGALLTSFAATRSNESGAKALLGYFASKLGAKKYEIIEKRGPANKLVTTGLLAGTTAFGKAAKLAAVPQIGQLLNGGFSGSKSYWETSGALWDNILVKGKSVKSEATKFNNIMKVNVREGAKLL